MPSKSYVDEPYVVPELLSGWVRVSAEVHMVEPSGGVMRWTQHKMWEQKCLFDKTMHAAVFFPETWIPLLSFPFCIWQQVSRFKRSEYCFVICEISDGRKRQLHRQCMISSCIKVSRYEVHLGLFSLKDSLAHVYMLDVSWLYNNIINNN